MDNVDKTQGSIFGDKEMKIISLKRNDGTIFSLSDKHVTGIEKSGSSFILEEDGLEFLEMAEELVESVEYSRIY